MSFVYTTERALKLAYPGDTAAGLDRRCGPIYDLNSPALAKHRRNSRDSIKWLTRAERDAYAAAIEAAIHQSNNAWWKRGPSDNPKPYSGAHRRAQLNADLLAYPAKVRRARSEAEWKKLYEEAMKEKRLLNSTTTTEAAAEFMKTRSSSLLIKDFPICTNSSRSSLSTKMPSLSPTYSGAATKPNTRSRKQSAPPTRTAVSPSTSTDRKVSLTTGSAPPKRCFIAGCKCDAEHIADKRSAAAFKAHETRRRLKAEAEARR